MGNVVIQAEPVCNERLTRRYLSGYGMFLSELELSANTRIAYRYQVSHFLSWLVESPAKLMRLPAKSDANMHWFARIDRKSPADGISACYQMP